MIELKDFVTRVLSDIFDGVKAVQQGRDPSSGEANPYVGTAPGTLQAKGHLLARSGQIIQEVKFDLAVTAEEGTATKGGIGVFAGAVGLGSQGESKAKETTVNRIQFEVPITLPYNK